MATMAQPQASAGQPGASAPSSAQRWRPYQIAFWLACLVIVIAFPLVISDPAYTTVAFFTLVFAAAGSAWNIFCGYTGYIALGHAVFFGTGCYALTIICARWHIAGGWAPFEFVPLAGLIAAVVAVPVAMFMLSPILLALLAPTPGNPATETMTAAISATAVRVAKMISAGEPRQKPLRTGNCRSAGAK